LEGVFRRDWEFRGMRLLNVLFGWETRILVGWGWEIEEGTPSFSIPV
jgi:hypothetical protein